MLSYHEFEMEVEIIPDEFVYIPNNFDSSEAAEMFGEFENDDDIEEFEEWISGLQSTRFFQVRTAIETIRQALSDYQADLSMERLLRAIRPA